MQRLFLTLALLLPLSIAALAQTVPSNQRPALNVPQALLRIERIQPGEAVCALVREDGTYRLEKLFRAKAEMYTGKASNDQVEQLSEVLGNAQLRKLSQENVSGDIVSDTLDKLDVAIWRERRWQTLSFHNPSSRKPFKDGLDPLLKWFQNLQKSRPAATRVGGAATRCLPDKEAYSQTSQTAEAAVQNPGASAEVGESTPPSPAARLESKYLFRFQSSEFAGTVMEWTCTVMFTDGTYRREERFEPLTGAKSNRSYGGQVNADSLAELKHLLDSSDLKNAHSDTGIEQSAQNGDFSAVFIPRENAVQHLVFVSEFNTVRNPMAQGGMSNMRYHVSDQKAIGPLKRWMKQHTDKLEGGSETGTAVNDCFPTRGK